MDYFENLSQRLSQIPSPAQFVVARVRAILERAGLSADDPRVAPENLRRSLR